MKNRGKNKEERKQDKKKERKILIMANFNQLLFRHIFETQIHIQTQILKTFMLALATNDFL